MIISYQHQDHAYIPVLKSAVPGTAHFRHVLSPTVLVYRRVPTIYNCNSRSLTATMANTTHLVISRSQEVLLEAVLVAALQHTVAGDFAVIHR